MNTAIACAFGALLILATTAPAAGPTTRSAGDEAYLFSSFRGNGEDGLHLAYSTDGLKWTALNGDKSYLKPTVGSERLMRDPCILQGPDGQFHMVWTTGWKGRDIGYASSKDLITWSEQRAIPVMGHEPSAKNCWAPELVYDPATQQYLIFWATTIPGRFPSTSKGGDGGYDHRIYSTTTRDFKTFTPTKLFFDPGFNVIDTTMLHEAGRYYLVFKDETKTPVKKHLRVAVSDKLEGPFGDISEPFTPDWVEGPTVLKVGGEFLCYFDLYTKHAYGAMRSPDMKRWTDATKEIRFPKGTRHGTAFPVSAAVLDKLKN